MRFVALVLAAAFCADAAYAQVTLSPAVTARAQGEMHSRIGAEVSAFRVRLGLDESVDTYCRGRMHLDTRNPSDGSVPFGVNYNLLRSLEELQQIISTREAFELNYLKLCLANYANEMRSAGVR